MKRTLGLAVLWAGLLCGCSDSEIHVDKVRASLQGLPPEQNTALEEALSDISSNNWAAAVKPLRTLEMKAKLNKDQAKILDDTMQKVLTQQNQKK